MCVFSCLTWPDRAADSPLQKAPRLSMLCLHTSHTCLLLKLLSVKAWFPALASCGHTGGSLFLLTPPISERLVSMLNLVECLAFVPQRRTTNIPTPVVSSLDCPHSVLSTADMNICMRCLVTSDVILKSPLNQRAWSIIRMHIVEFTQRNKMQLGISNVILWCVVKETLLEQKTFCEVVGAPPTLKGGTIRVAAAQTVTRGFCGQSKERDGGKPDTNRPTVAADFIFQIALWLNGKWFKLCN